MKTTLDLSTYQSLVVSCKALEDEPLYGTHHMVAMARAAIMGNASGIRANGIDDVSAIKKELETTVIGLNKKHYSNSDVLDRKSTRLNSSHVAISYAVFCVKK